MSAMSSTSTNGSGTPSAGSASSPARMPSSMKLSLKFCANQVARRIVARGATARTRCSALSASSSPRPESSTIRSRAGRHGLRGERRDGVGRAGHGDVGIEGDVDAADAGERGGHVSRSSQSNAGVAEREPIRTGTPRASSRCATRRPVLPVPPRTRMGELCVGHAQHETRELVRRSMAQERGSVRERLRSRHGSGRRTSRRAARPGRVPPPLAPRPAVVDADPGRGAAHARRGGARRGVDRPRRRRARAARARRRRDPARAGAVRRRRRPGHAAAGDHPPRPALHHAGRRGAHRHDDARRAHVGQHRGRRDRAADRHLRAPHRHEPAAARGAAGLAGPAARATSRAR